MKPQISLARPSTGRMWFVSACALATIIQSALSDSFSSLILAGTVALSAILIEFLFYFRTERSGRIADGSAVASALVLTLLLPNHLPPLYGIAGAVFAIAVVKNSFGGLGTNWLNPALGGWLFIRFSWPDAFNSITRIPAETTPFAAAALDFLNRTIFSHGGPALTEQALVLLNNPASGIIVDRGILAFLAGSIFLFAAWSGNRAWIPAIFIGATLLLVEFFGGGDLFSGLFSGGTLAAAFLLCADPSTGAKYTQNVLLLALITSFIAFFFRYYCGELFGALYAVVLVNTGTSFVRKWENRMLYAASPEGTRVEN
ncbi:electron transport complex subunit D [Spirochaetia bacterium]|nr:electron transport complex subunit D [Spirochaetia bacterium]GHU34128.1 electron transport complex subunit D [Spirochaetia bacterium]